MTRLERVIKAFNDYDNFIKNNTVEGWFEQRGHISNTPATRELYDIRREVSVLIGELKRYGCRREN